MRTRASSERGSALVVAMFAISFMLMIGLATYSLVDGQQVQGTKAHVSESAFNLSNSALNGQLFQLGRTWPKSTTDAYPTWCDSSSTSTLCPSATQLSSSFTSAEYASGTCAGGTSNGWRTAVRDNGSGSASYYDPAVVPSQPSYDANGDGAMWVRADGTAKCRTRSLVALVKLTPVTLPFPRNVVTSNWLKLQNNGRKVIIDTLGSYAQPPSARPPPNAQAGGVAARCVSAPTPCVDYVANKGQISPDTTQINTGGSATTLTEDQLEGMRLVAKNYSTYYPAGTCPPTLTGKLVFVEDLTGCSGYRGGNTSTSPGVLVFMKGTVSFGGNSVFYGIIYAGNRQNSTSAVVSIGGTAAIQGAVVVDGPGGVHAGASGTNIVFDSRAFSLLQGLANATLVPNTWRQVPST